MILVTGATGLVGSTLVKSLVEKGFRVRAMKREQAKIPKILFTHADQIEWVNADLLDYFSIEDAMQGCNQVYHCAAFVSFQPQDEKLIWKVNVEGTRHMVNAALALNIEKFLHVSSIASLGDVKLGNSIDEKSKWVFHSQLSTYSISKFESEREVWRGITEGLNAIIVNPSIILGFDEFGNGSMSFIKYVEKGYPFYTDGSSGFVWVDDVVSAMIKLMESDISFEKFIISSENLTYKKLFELIAKYLQVKAPNWKAPYWLMMLVFYVQSIFTIFSKSHSLLTKYTLRSSSKKHVINNQKLKEAINFEYTSIDDCLATIVSQWRTTKKN